MRSTNECACSFLFCTAILQFVEEMQSFRAPVGKTMRSFKKQNSAFFWLNDTQCGNKNEVPLFIKQHMYRKGIPFLSSCSICKENVDVTSQMPLSQGKTMLG